MALPNVKNKSIDDALTYIDQHGVPPKNQSWKYDLEKNGKRYPPKYVIAVAKYLEKQTSNINTDLNCDPQALREFLTNRGFTISKKQSELHNKYSNILLESKNIIFRGAPGTGKTYLAKQVAANIISNGEIKEFANLKGKQRSQVEFVQFHPSYDYSDFVEGLRPKLNRNGSMGFELKDGIFKSFVDKARKDSCEEKYIFIIDEINRGEISKILGELFFSIDPGYRGQVGEVATQYSNMHVNRDEKFYIPDNVYIIGTMNDIDRSVDSFDFAMRRRFRFVEVRAEETQDMLESIANRVIKNEAIARMDKLNEAIKNTEGLNENYQIGASYFLKLKKDDDDIDFDHLWKDHLEPLLQEYVRGFYDEKGKMDAFANAYKLI